MSSSLEDEFSPPDWATKEEVIKAARHYINYWKVEAQHRNGQWLDELEKRAKAMADATFIEAQRNLLKANLEKSDNAVWTLSVENTRLKAEVENSNRINTELLLLSNQQASEVRRLKAEVERLRKAGDAMAKAIRWLPQSISDHHLDAWNAAKEGKQS